MADNDIREQLRVLQEKVAEQERQRAEDLETLRQATARPPTKREVQNAATEKMRNGRDPDPAGARERRREATATRGKGAESDGS